MSAYEGSNINTNTANMSIEWAHQFCLACDKQTDGATYCSESCRLADYESTSAQGSEPNSPALAAPQEWFFSKSSTTGSSRLYLSPAFNLSTPQLFAAGATQRTLTSRGFEPSSSSNPGPVLSPSNSYSSLCSMKSSTSSTSTESSTQLTSKASQELRAYARSFDSVRLQRRRSY